MFIGKNSIINQYLTLNESQSLNQSESQFRNKTEIETNSGVKTLSMKRKIQSINKKSDFIEPITKINYPNTYNNPIPLNQLDQYDINQISNTRQNNIAFDSQNSYLKDLNQNIANPQNIYQQSAFSQMSNQQNIFPQNSYQQPYYSKMSNQQNIDPQNYYQSSYQQPVYPQISNQQNAYSHIQSYYPQMNNQQSFYPPSFSSYISYPQNINKGKSYNENQIQNNEGLKTLSFKSKLF